MDKDEYISVRALNEWDPKVCLFKFNSLWTIITSHVCILVFHFKT